MSSSIEVQIQEILDDYSETTKEKVERVCNDVAKEAVNKLKASSPGSGKYKKGWTKSKVNGGYVVHNKGQPHLTHLIENGHVVKNQYGTPKKAGAKLRVAGKQHIAPVERWGASEFEKRVRSEL